MKQKIKTKRGARHHSRAISVIIESTAAPYNNILFRMYVLCVCMYVCVCVYIRDIMHYYNIVFIAQYAYV